MILPYMENCLQGASGPFGPSHLKIFLKRAKKRTESRCSPSISPIMDCA